MAKKKNDITEDAKYWIEYGVNLRDRVIMLDEEIEDFSTGFVIRALMEMMSLDKVKPIDIIVNSYGGSVYDGLMLCDEIEDLIEKGVEIRTHAKGKIMSMALVIFCCGSTRFSGERVTFMAHSVSSGTEGKIHEQKVDLQESIRLNNELLDILAEKTNKTRNFWAKEIEYKDKYFNKEQAVKLGIVTEE